LSYAPFDNLRRLPGQLLLTFHYHAGPARGGVALFPCLYGGVTSVVETVGDGETSPAFRGPKSA